MESASAAYLVGIDLGTTHSVMSYLSVDALDPATKDQARPELFPISQLVGPGQLNELSQLPSFLFLPAPDTLSDIDTHLAWSQDQSSQPGVVGDWARSLGEKTPFRCVSSAKSWLSHAGIDRRQACLPVSPGGAVSGSEVDLEQISPYQATLTYLSYLQQAWNARFADAPLEDQKLVITVPASFDPVARELTADAAKSLGLTQLTLLEEPQAALYHWVAQLGEAWRDQLSVDDLILVVDVGGGTTDLSLIKVEENEGALRLERVAVGDHILLGGDNMDLALAYCIKTKLAAEGKNLEQWQVLALTGACRRAKETLFADEQCQSAPIVVPSRGSKLIGGSLRSELTREDLVSVLVEGFFPKVASSDMPRQAPRSGLAQVGLPYAQDAAITKHLAHFLSRQAQALADQSYPWLVEGQIRPTGLLLNGGVFKAKALSKRVLDTLNTWWNGTHQIDMLDGIDLDLAVAKGAAFYHLARSGQGVRIRSGLANSYYLGVESSLPAIPGMPVPLQALCVAPFGLEEGSSTSSTPQVFSLVVGEAVVFRFFGSTLRHKDQVGSFLEDAEHPELEALSDVEIALPAQGRFGQGNLVQVTLSSHVTELGTLEVTAHSVDGDESWRVSLEVRQHEAVAA